MTFTEAKTVENPIIDELISPSLGWRYEPGEEVTRKHRTSEADVLLEDILKQKLQDLNPETITSEGHADRVLSSLKMIRNNQEWMAWLRGDKTFKFGVGDQAKYVPVKLIDYDDISRNDFLVTNQFTIEGKTKPRRPDILLFVNGIPLVDIEAKTASRGTLDWREGAKQTCFYATEEIPLLYFSNVFCVGVDELELRYGIPCTSLEYWHKWRKPWPHDIDSFDRMKCAIYGLFDRDNFLDLVRNFVVSEQEKGQTVKKIARWQQYYSANELVQRATQTDAVAEARRGVVWHTQGSGKSLTVLCAARKLWYDPDLSQPTIIVVVDRRQLLDQMLGQFFNTNTENVTEAHSIPDLRKKLDDDHRGIIITTVHRFEGMQNEMSARSNIIMLVDEAHRTQEGDLGTFMRAALPNASLFGFTGTPIERDDKNTPRTFGKQVGPDEFERYMTPRYSIQDALEDEAIIPLHYELRLSDWQVWKEDLDQKFETLFAHLSEAQREVLKDQESKLATILKHPQRVTQIAQDIAQHFRRKVRPNGFKAMLVCYDKEHCVLHKKALDTLLGPEASFIVISEDEKRDAETEKKTGVDIRSHYLGDEGRKRAVNDFKRPKPDDPAKLNDPAYRFQRAEIVIVCDMLLTGFDAPVVQAMYLDKGLRDHNLLQAIARVNRRYNEIKQYGLILDYFGVFDDLNAALNYDKAELGTVAFPYAEFRDAFRVQIEALTELFEDFDRSGSHDSLIKILIYLNDDEDVREAFDTGFRKLRNIYEVLSPDPFLRDYLNEYTWLLKLYVLYRKRFNPNEPVDVDMLDGAKTRELIRDHVDVEALQKDFPTYTLDANYLIKVQNLEPDAKALEIETTLTSVLTLDEDDEDLMPLSERLQRIIDRKRAGNLAGATLIQELQELSQEVIEVMEEYKRPVAESIANAAKEHKENITDDQARKAAEAIVEKARELCFDGWYQQPHMEVDLFREFTLLLARHFRALELHQKDIGFVDRVVRILKKRRFIPGKQE